MISKYYEKKIQSLPWALYLSQLIIEIKEFCSGAPLGGERFRGARFNS